jgi:predicted Zn finger-like uncharacterized protein
MPVSVHCPSCGARINVPDQLLGRDARCPRCNAAIQLPAAPAIYRQPADPLEEMVAPRRPSRSYDGPRRCSGETNALTIIGIVAGLLALLGMFVG